MAKRQFTEEEIAFLRRNPYTAYVDENTLSFTVPFKIEYMRLHNEGVPPREILPRLGYPIEIIGKSRLVGISQKVRGEAESKLGFREPKHRRMAPLLDVSPEVEAALTDRQMINRLQCEVAYSGVSKKTVNRVLKRAKELNIFWPLEANETDAVLAEKLFPSAQKQVSSTKRMPDFNYIQKELLRNGVNKKLLWTEYLEECRQSGDDPLMYSQFCYYIQQDEQKRRATMHINRKPGEQIEVDWAGDPAQITDPDTGEIIPAFLFVGVMTYSQYPYVEAFIDEKQRAWITAHVHMYEYFGGVTRILVPDNTKTAVIHNNDWYNQELNTIYHEMAEH